MKVNLRLALLKEFFNFLNVFLKKVVNELLPYYPYNHYIILKGKVKLSFTPLYNMLKEELN
jgi:hypothetical protein